MTILVLIMDQSNRRAIGNDPEGWRSSPRVGSYEEGAHTFAAPRLPISFSQEAGSYEEQV